MFTVIVTGAAGRICAIDIDDPASARCTVYHGESERVGRIDVECAARPALLVAKVQSTHGQVYGVLLLRIIYAVDLYSGV